MLATRNVTTRLHLAQETIVDIDAAVARGDAAAWRAYHAGEMTMNELILRMWVSGRERMANDVSRLTPAELVAAGRTCCDQATAWRLVGPLAEALATALAPREDRDEARASRDVE